MRMLLEVSIPTETGNAAAKAGTLGSTIEAILAPLKPEAVYFIADDDGQRAGFGEGGRRLCESREAIRAVSAKQPGPASRLARRPRDC
jgi:hypothetical protein